MAYLGLLLLLVAAFLSSLVSAGLVPVQSDVFRSRQVTRAKLVERARGKVSRSILEPNSFKPRNHVARSGPSLTPCPVSQISSSLACPNPLVRDSQLLYATYFRAGNIKCVSFDADFCYYNLQGQLDTTQSDSDCPENAVTTTPTCQYWSYPEDE